jgi:hypothetical protein
MFGCDPDVMVPFASAGILPSRAAVRSDRKHREPSRFAAERTWRIPDNAWQATARRMIKRNWSETLSRCVASTGAYAVERWYVITRSPPQRLIRVWLESPSSIPSAFCCRVRFQCGSGRNSGPCNSPPSRMAW